MKGQELRDFRVETLGMTVKDFSKALNTDTRTLHRWETEERAPTGPGLAIIRGLKELLKVPEEPFRNELIAMIQDSAYQGGIIYILRELR